MRRDLFGVRSGAALLSATAALAVGLQSVSAAVTPRQYPTPYGSSSATIGWIGSSLQSTPIGNNLTTSNNSFIVDVTNGLKGQFATEVVSPTVPGGGSGKCIAALTVRDPAFPVCGSDDPLSVANQTLITAGANVSNQTGTPSQASPIHQVPVLVAPVSVIANLGSAACNGVSLNLRSPIIAKIFDGVITSWTDPTIAADNGPIAGCLSAAGTIKPVVRSDVSGTTYLFKDYLSKRNAEYIALKQDVPAGSAVVPNTTWLTGTVPGSTIDPRDGNTGVVNEVVAVTGAIGYASTAAVGTANVDTAAVDSSNPALFFQKPASPLCTTAAATVPPMSTLANWSSESFTDSPIGYPICGYSFEFIFNNLETAYNGAVTQYQAGVALDLVKYALSSAGQAAAFSAANGGFDTIPSAQQTIDDEETQTITYSASSLPDVVHPADYPANTGNGGIGQEASFTPQMALTYQQKQQWFSLVSASDPNASVNVLADAGGLPTVNVGCADNGEACPPTAYQISEAGVVEPDGYCGPTSANNVLYALNQDPQFANPGGDDHVIYQIAHQMGQWSNQGVGRGGGVGPGSWSGMMAINYYSNSGNNQNPYTWEDLKSGGDLWQRVVTDIYYKGAGPIFNISSHGWDPDQHRNRYPLPQYPPAYNHGHAIFHYLPAFGYKPYYMLQVFDENNFLSNHFWDVKAEDMWVASVMNGTTVNTNTGGSSGSKPQLLW